MIYHLKHQIYFRVVSGHIVSALANRLSNDYKSDLADSQQTVNILKPNA